MNAGDELVSKFIQAVEENPGAAIRISPDVRERLYKHALTAEAVAWLATHTQIKILTDRRLPDRSILVERLQA